MDKRQEADGELGFREKRRELLTEAVHKLSEANSWFSDDGYPGWRQVDSALTAIRQALSMPEYAEIAHGTDEGCSPFTTKH